MRGSISRYLLNSASKKDLVRGSSEHLFLDIPLYYITKTRKSSNIGSQGEVQGGLDPLKENNL